MMTSVVLLRGLCPLRVTSPFPPSFISRVTNDPTGVSEKNPKLLEEGKRMQQINKYLVLASGLCRPEPGGPRNICHLALNGA